MPTPSTLYQTPNWIPEQGMPVLAAAQSLGGPLLVERSVKWIGGKVLEGRFLVSFPKRSLYPAPKRSLENLCSALGAPQDEIPMLISLLPAATNVHLGFEPEEGGSRVKCYLEFTPQEAPEPDLVFWALKWINDDKNHKPAISRYWSRTEYSLSAKQALVASVLPVGIIKDAMLAAFDIISEGAGPAALLEVEEPGNPRRSLDLNLANSKCKLADLGGEVAEFFPTLMKSEGASPLGHIAAGISRNGKPFMTLYYGAEAIK